MKKLSLVNVLAALFFVLTAAFVLLQVVLLIDLLEGEKMKIFVLDRDYAFDELDRGVSMTYHPQFGERALLSNLRFDERSRRFFIENTGAWSRGTRRYLVRIGDGRDYRKGECYPVHWSFCPFTGEKLK